jgi:hypothetical protein
MSRWSLADLGIAGVTVLGVIPSLIIAAIVFTVGFAVLAIYGLISAVLWALGGVALIWIMSWFGVFKRSYLKDHPKAYLLFLVIPAFFTIGYFTDHIPELSAIAPAQFISSNPSITAMQMNAEGQAINFVMSNTAFGAMAIVAATALILYSYVKLKK